MNRVTTLEQGGILIATTIGAGIFSLPWVLVHVGWVSFTGLLLLLGVIVASTELLYWRVINGEEGGVRLVGLARRHLGRAGAFLAAIGIFGGLLAALLAFLILGSRFLNFSVPIADGNAIVIFWVLAAWPALLGIRQFAKMETAGSVAKCLLIVTVFLMLWGGVSFHIPAFGAGPVGLAALAGAFGAILFALSGWNAVEPMTALAPGRPRRGVVWVGLGLVAILYILFSVSIGASVPASEVAPDAISSFGGNHWHTFMLALLGLIAVWSAYSPVAVELQNTLADDCGVPAPLARALVLVAPPILVLGGVRNILTVIAVGGGVFVAIQYLTILLVGLRALKLKGFPRLLAMLGILVFTLAAAAEIYRFIGI